MTQTEKLLARIRQLEKSPGLYEIVLYIHSSGEIGFWIIEKTEHKLEGEIMAKIPEK